MKTDFDIPSMAAASEMCEFFCTYGGVFPLIGKYGF
jgi:hypothetical protein